jgi:hypothetical protein
MNGFDNLKIGNLYIRRLESYLEKPTIFLLCRITIEKNCKAFMDYRKYYLYYNVNNKSGYIIFFDHPQEVRNSDFLMHYKQIT